jgi:multidrug transporter EmrE-like cation transporter
MITFIGLVAAISISAAIMWRMAWLSFISRAVFFFVATFAAWLTFYCLPRGMTPLDLAVVYQGYFVCQDIGWFGTMTNACEKAIVQEALDGYRETRED